MVAGLGFPSPDLALGLAARDDLNVDGELDLGEEVDLGFLRLCFLGGLATSEVVMSL